MQKIDKSQVAGLPPHAQMQYMAGTPRIYFQYTYRVDGKKYNERDYLGTVDELTLEFIPNAYFMRENPVFEYRPIHRFKNEIKRAREIERRNKELLARKQEILKNESAEAATAVEPVADEFKAGKNTLEVATIALGKNKVEATGSVPTVSNETKAQECEAEVAANPPVAMNKAAIVDLEEPADILEPNESRQAGASAVAMVVLLQTGMLEDLYYALDGNIKDTIKLVNLAVHAATTALATYNAHPASFSQLFIGGKCLSSPRASEFYQRIGASQSVNKKISQARLKRVGRKGLIALDGTKIPCNSRNIAIAAVGKDKQGGFSKQISFSLLAHIPTGQAVGYEYYAGNIPDISLIDYYVNQWEAIGVKDTDVTFAMDRGLFSQETVVKLYGSGIKFIIGMKTNVKAAADVIKERNYEFFEATALVGSSGCYGVKTPWNLTLEGRTANVDMFLYRNPNKATEESLQLKKKLLEFKKSWDEGCHDYTNNLLLLCKNPVDGKKLAIDWSAYNQECYLHGFFAIVSNLPGLKLEQALQEYSTRNEVEVMFKLMFQNLLRTTRVHSLAALSGLLLAVFVALNILGVLRRRMQAKLPKSWLGKNPDATIKSRLGLAEMLWNFESIRLDRTGNGKLKLIGNTVKLRDLAGAIGMEGLFDSPVHVARLFSPSYLERIICAK